MLKKPHFPNYNKLMKNLADTSSGCRSIRNIFRIRVGKTRTSMLPITRNNMAIVMTITVGKDTMIGETIEANIRVAIGTNRLILVIKAWRSRPGSEA